MISLPTAAQVLLFVLVLGFLSTFLPKREQIEPPLNDKAREQKPVQTPKAAQPRRPATSHLQKDPIPMVVDPPSNIDPTAVKQNYDAYLVLDVEATCQPGTDFNYANEIIEWPVCLLRWKYKDKKGKASRLEVVDEFRSFVKPVWRPQLSSFCTSLTGITQEDVDAAPHFSTLMHTTFRDFLTRNGLIDAETGAPLERFCWCSDGPWDIRDFVVKTCFMSKIPLPTWLSGEVMDVRRVVACWQERDDPTRKTKSTAGFSSPRGSFLPLVRQLQVLGLGAFQGRQHCGIDDTRNIARIVVELARRGMPLKPNLTINPQRRWPWMGKNGRVLEEYLMPAATFL